MCPPATSASTPTSCSRTSRWAGVGVGPGAQAGAQVAAGSTATQPVPPGTGRGPCRLHLSPQKDQHSAAGAQRNQHPHGQGGEGETGDSAGGRPHLGLFGVSWSPWALGCDQRHRSGTNPFLAPWQFLFVSLRQREATYQLLRSVCKHLQVCRGWMGRGAPSIHCRAPPFISPCPGQRPEPSRLREQ